MDFNRELRLTPSQAQHLLVMRAVAEHLQDTPYVLKGGSALILTRSLDRYSTDLDFDSDRKLNLSGRIEAVLKSLNEIELRSLKLVKDTDTVQRYKIHYANQQTGEDTLLKIETSFRNSPPRQAIENVAGIKTYRIEYLFDQKLRAALNRTEGRDLYDLAFLVEQFGTQLNNDQIEAARKFVAKPDQLVEQYRLTFQIDQALTDLTTIEDVVLSLHCGIEKLQNQRIQELPTGELALTPRTALETDSAQMWQRYSQGINTAASTIVAVEAAKRALSANHPPEVVFQMLTQDPQYQQYLRIDRGDRKRADVHARALLSKAEIDSIKEEEARSPEQSQQVDKSIDGPTR